MTRQTVPSSRFDVAVIGAGVVGCALARRFALDGASVLVLEKAADVLDGASKGNSAILHTAFDAPPGSLEAATMRASYGEFMAIRERLGLPLLKTGALVIAWTADEEARLPAIVAQAHENGVADVALLSAAETRRLEPALGPGVRASVRVPGEHVIDPWSTAHAYLFQAVENGAAVVRACEVRGGAFDGDAWHLDTARGAVDASLVVNAAGLYGDVVDQRLLGASPFTIRPRKGQFIVYDKGAAALAGHILLPVPTEVTKGVVVCRTAWGNLLVGPTAQEQDARDAAPLTEEAMTALKARGEAILPELAAYDITAAYAGLRPATEEKAYRIRYEAERRYVAVGGIRSTGLTAALGIARHVAQLVGDAVPSQPLADPVWPKMANLAEHAPRDWEAAGNGGIVCHCERVTRREIEAALAGPMPPATLAGLKRRTRVTMGRCQGFYCLPEVAAIAGDRLDPPVAVPFDD